MTRVERQMMLLTSHPRLYVLLFVMPHGVVMVQVVVEHVSHILTLLLKPMLLSGFLLLSLLMILLMIVLILLVLFIFGVVHTWNLFH
jgi:hypothetical protein